MTARDTAQYILEQRGAMTSMKLQKLLYYTQVWSIVWDDNVLFPEPIEAWKNGPVVRDVWEVNRGQFRISEVDGGNSSALNDNQKETVDKVLQYYGDKDAQWLSDLTHMEKPWCEAMAKGQSTALNLETISEYYSTIAPEIEEASAY